MYAKHFIFPLLPFFNDLLVSGSVLGNCFHLLSNLFTKITMNPI